MFIDRRTLAAALAGLCLAWLPAAAQQGPAKALVIIRDFDDPIRLALALHHAGGLKRGGAEVRLVFQDEAVLAALYLPLAVEAGGLKEDPPADLFEERPYPLHDYDTSRLSQHPTGNRLAVTGKVKFAGKLEYPPVILNAAWAEVKALKIPYEVSSMSAKIYNILEDLKAKGEPLTQDADKTPDIAVHVRAGYKVVVF